MDTRQIAAEYRLSHWASIVKDRQESGLSIKAYCKRAGFHENVYFYWQRKLRIAACEQHSEISDLSQPTSQPTSLMARGFTEVKLSASDGILPSPETISSGEVCIEISNLCITANAAYPPSQLAELIKEVISPC